LTLTIVTVSCNPFGCRDREERYFVDVDARSKEITFNRKLSECVNGFDNDDFAWQTIVVDDAMLDEQPLTLRHGNRGGKYQYYSASPADSNYNGRFTFWVKGQRYQSIDSEPKSHGDHIRLEVRSE
jgi:hypothetical protein